MGCLFSATVLLTDNIQRHSCRSFGHFNVAAPVVVVLFGKILTEMQAAAFRSKKGGPAYHFGHQAHRWCCDRPGRSRLLPIRSLWPETPETALCRKSRCRSDVPVCGHQSGHEYVLEKLDAKLPCAMVERQRQVAAFPVDAGNVAGMPVPRYPVPRYLEHLNSGPLHGKLDAALGEECDLGGDSLRHAGHDGRIVETAPPSSVSAK